MSQRRWTACHQARAKQARKNKLFLLENSKNVIWHSHVLGEQKNTGNFGHKEYTVVNIIFQSFMWDTSGTQS